MISARDLRKSYGPATILGGVSLDVAPGECLTLLGPNGVGKTTLLRILATLTRPTSGRLTVAGIDALKNAEGVRAVIGMVAHGSYVYEDLTARENLRFWSVMGGRQLPDTALRAALQQVELDSVAEERARTFSSGMKRRLGLARVILGQARVLLLDEPFTGLDRRGIKWLTEFLLGFKAGGGAIVMVSHHFSSILGVADRAAILVAGRVAVDRSAADLSADDLRHLYDSLTLGDGEVLA
jgi:heme ABC exporter ATP-binding subunit CcmA